MLFASFANYCLICGVHNCWQREYPNCSHSPRRRGRHIVRGDFFTKVTSHSFCRGSFPNRTRYRWAPVWVRRCAAVFSGHEKISILTVPSKIKGHLLCRCPFILGSAGQRPAPPFRISMLGVGKGAAGQKAGWVVFLQRSCQSQISIFTVPSQLNQTCV